MGGAPVTPGGIFQAADLALMAAVYSQFIALGVQGLARGLFLTPPVLALPFGGALGLSPLDVGAHLVSIG
jgi:hypothetical protein